MTSAVRYVLGKQSILASSLRYVLIDICGVAEGRIGYAADHSITATLGDTQTVAGLVPLVTLLRREGQTAEQRSFLGEDAEAVSQINQWLLMTSRLAHEASQASEHRLPIAEHIYGEIEKAIQLSGRKSAYLTGALHATIADVLLYTAVLSHPAHACAQALTTEWTEFMQRDDIIQPIQITHMTGNGVTHTQHDENKSAPPAEPVAPKTAVKKQGHDRSAYSRPSEEEIELRRKVKERQKTEKLLKKAQQNAAESASTAPTQPAGGDPANGATHATSCSAAEPSSSTSTAGTKKATAAASTLHSDMLDVRVGRFTNVRRHPSADRLYVEDMDLGSERRTIISGIVENYTIEELEGTLCLVICNMKPKNMMGVTSHGMIMCASNHTQLSIVRPPSGAQPGDRVAFDATAANEIPSTSEDVTSSSPIPVHSSQKTRALLSHLHTDGQGTVCWRYAPARHVRSGETLAVPALPNSTVS